MKKYFVFNPLKLLKILSNKDLGLIEKLKYSLPLGFCIYMLTYTAVFREEIELEQQQKKEAFEKEMTERKMNKLELIKNAECESSIWEINGKDVVDKVFGIVSVSNEMGEGTYTFHKLPKKVEDIECDWAKDFIFSKSGDLRKYNIFLSYPENEEYVDCFCKGFVTAAEKYILEKNN